MRIHVGCGKRVLDGYTNVDLEVSPKAKRRPEILADARSIPLPDGCADEVLAVHVAEHFYRAEIDDVIREWKRLLKVGGALIIEMPDILKCAKNLIDWHAKGSPALDQMAMWGIYGENADCAEHMAHKYGWTPETMAALLKAHGFTKIVERSTQFHRVGQAHRDMRIEATRG